MQSLQKAGNVKEGPCKRKGKPRQPSLVNLFHPDGNACENTGQTIALRFLVSSSDVGRIISA